MILAQGMVEYSAFSAFMDSMSAASYSVRDWLGSFTLAERTAAGAVLFVALLLWTRRRQR